MIVLFVYEPFLQTNPFVFSFIATLAFVFIEAAMLSTWGTTPGKAILRVSIVRGDGQLPSYNEALSRSLRVWIRGMGMNLPIVTLVTQARAYTCLSREGVTSWDRDGELNVHHQLIGPLRIAAVVLIFAVFVLLIAVGAGAGSGCC